MPSEPLGAGWHHEWEGFLTCEGDGCTVARGVVAGEWFTSAGTAPSLDGTESWSIYRGGSGDVLVRRPSGEWIAYSTDGSEYHYGTVCDSGGVIPCGTVDPSGGGTAFPLPEYCPDPACIDPLEGGRARLVGVVDRAGNAIALSYDRPSGLLLGLEDELGHTLQARGEPGDRFIRRLEYDGSVVATYEYSSSSGCTSGLSVTRLDRVKDAEGALMRSYDYAISDFHSRARLLAVRNEAGDPVAEFAYDAEGRASGVVDARSNVAIGYGEPDASGRTTVSVTEYYADTSSTSERVLTRRGDVESVSEGCSCGRAQTLTRSHGRVECSTDSMGHVTYTERDDQGRVTRWARYDAQSHACPPDVAALPARYEEAWFGYELTKPVASGVSVRLDHVTSVASKSALGGTNLVGEEYDHDPTPRPEIDPAGYSCHESFLPVGAVVCRRIESGYVSLPTGTVLERHATFHSYDPRGRLVRTVGPVKLDNASPDDVTPIEERTYWADGETLPRRGRLHEVKRYPAPSAPPHVTAYDYDAFGPFQITDPRGVVTTIVKDIRGRPWHVSRAGRTVTVTYYDGQLPGFVELPSHLVFLFEYDSKGRVRNALHGYHDDELGGLGFGWREHYEYDPAGNPRLAEIQSNHNGYPAVWRRERTFDVRHRVVSEHHPELPGTEATWSYDPSGLLETMVDEEGRITEFTPDAVGRPRTVTRRGQGRDGSPVSLLAATYGFQDYTGALSSVVDGSGGQTTYVRDDFGRLASVDSPTFKEGSLKYEYDARGNATRRTGGRVAVDYTYDGLDRLLTVSATNSADGEGMLYTLVYDERGEVGLLTTVLEPERATQYDYYPDGQLSTETATVSGVAVPLVTSYSYDAGGLLDTVTYPSGLRIQYWRDPWTMQVQSVHDLAGTGPFASQVRRLFGGPILSLNFGNGQTLTQSFDLRYQPDVISSGPVSLDYTMSPAGNVRLIDEDSTRYSYGYDFMGRLAEFAPGHAPADALTHQYARDRIKQSLAANGTRRYAYAYDHQGNVSAIGRYDASGSTVQTAVCLKHDALGRLVLVGATSPANVAPDGVACTAEAQVTSVIARFKYDLWNRRVARWLASTGTWTYLANAPDGNPLSEMTLTASPSSPWAAARDYVWLDSRPLAHVEYPGPAGSGAGYRYYYHLDHIGLPRALTNQVGQVVWRASQPRPYGDIVESTTPDPVSGRTVVTNLRLPGQYDERLLGSLGLQGPYYNWNRWYLPGVGRYLELDPIAVGGGRFNGAFGRDWYNYANGTPLRYTDPEGLLWAPPVPWWVAAGTIVATGVGVVVIGGIIFWPGEIGGDPCEKSPEGCNMPLWPQPAQPDPGPAPGPGPGLGPDIFPIPEPQPEPEECSPLKPPKYKKKCEAHFDKCWPILGMNQCRDCVGRCIGNNGKWPFDQPECNYGQ